MTSKIKKIVISATLAVALPLVGCATTGQPLSVERKVAGCLATTAIAAGLGALIAGKGDRTEGALIGGAIGAGACAVWLAFENEKDKERLRQVRLQAAQEGKEVNQTWTGDDGRVRTVRSIPSAEQEYVLASASAAPTAQPERKICKSIANTATVSGQSQSVTEVWCRDSLGNWAASTEVMTLASVSA